MGSLILRARKRRGGEVGHSVSRQDYEAINAADAQRAMRFFKVRMSVGKAPPAEPAP